MTGATGPTGPVSDSRAPSFSKLTCRVIKVPSNRRIRVVRVFCRGGDCRIRKATAFFTVGGKTSRGRTTFRASSFPSGSSAVTKVVVPKRVYRRLKSRKSGSLNVTVLATSSNGTRNQNTLRNGLRR